MMSPLSTSLSPSQTQSGAKGGDAAEPVPKVVRDAQIEMDRLITALIDDETPAQMDNFTFDSREPGASLRGPASSAPLYLIISSRRALTKKHGEAAFQQLNGDLRELKRAVETGSRRHSGADLEAVIAYVDDEASMSRLGFQPVDPVNPWQVKKFVDSMDDQLAEHGREIRYLLIVGGDEIIPFHRLPNPVDDQDPDVPSDNPYASRDANYLIPERAIGRMPDGANRDVAFLCNLIQTSVEAHRRIAVSKGLLGVLGNALNGIRGMQRNGCGLGYSASIWRKASRAVFRVIGDDGRLRTCPPLTYEHFQVADPPHFSYFNLHGIEDGPNWYGQRDALFPADYPLFPLALRPQDPSIKQHADAVVFTEACYGANILGKSEANSIALRLMAVGALAVVGSTKISYGSIAPPLLGADLVGKHFWEGLQARGADGGPTTVGEALRHAKVTMASEMQEKQGYLDDEDQKALISFVLYGDPSLPIISIQRGAATVASADVLCPPIICSQRVQAQKGALTGSGVRPASDELVARVKARVETSLPHMSHARVQAKPLTVCTGVCEDGCDLLDNDLRPSLQVSVEQKDLHQHGRNWALTLQKSIPVMDDTASSGLGCGVVTSAHHQVVKVVVDENGHILRMAVSK